MSWFTNALKVASVGMDIASKAEEVHRQRLLEQQGKEIIISKFILQELRDKIFVFNNTAKEILEKFDEEPKYSTAAMAILEDELRQSGITSDIFPNIPDKEYTSNTHKLIQSSLTEMYSSLSEDEQDRISTLAKATNEVEKSQYYLDHYDDIVEMDHAKRIVNELEERNGCIGTLIAGFFIFIATPFSLMLILGLTYETTDIEQVPLIITGIIVYSLILYLYYKWKKNHTYKEAKNTYDELSEKVNIDLFYLVENELGSDYDQIEKRHKYNKQMIKEFWANS